MLIDARTGEITDILKQLKAIFPSCCSDEETIEVITINNKDAQKVKAFAAISGFKTAIYHEDDHYRVSISGSSCGCFR